MEKLLENEMELHLIEKGYNIYDEEKCIDSTLVVDYAIREGFDSYMLGGDGNLSETLIFISK